jgi:pimeloyl-ACP methyl ester carboxylesterase
MRLKLVFAAVVATAAFLALRRAGLREDLSWNEVDKPGRIVDVDGYGVHVVEMGAGPAVLLVHGFGGHTYSYRRLMPLLATDYRVVAVDLKGYGFSQRDAAAGLSFTDQAAMLHALLRRLAIDRAAVVGHSMGGAVVQRLAVTHPDDVSAIVLAASFSPGGRGRRVPAIPAPLLRPFLPLLAGFAASRILRLSYYDAGSLTAEVGEGYLRPARIVGSMDGLLASMRDRAHDPPFDPRAIHQPVLVLAGSHDRVVPLSSALKLRADYPEARVVVVDRAGHLLLEEQPEACAEAIRGFLAESEAQPQRSQPVGA